MRTIFFIILSIAVLCSCGSTKGFQAVRVDAGWAEFQEDGLSGDPVAAVGTTFQNDLDRNGRPQGWVGDIAAALTVINDDMGGADLEGDREELDLGTRFYPDTDNCLLPYVGFGAAVQRLHLADGDAGSVTDVMVGAYWTAGLDIHLGGGLYLGVAYRATAGIETELGDDDEETDLDAGAFLLSIGVQL